MPGTVSDGFWRLGDGFWLYFCPCASLSDVCFPMFFPVLSVWARRGSCLRRVQMTLSGKRERRTLQLGIWVWLVASRSSRATWFENVPAFLYLVLPSIVSENFYAGLVDKRDLGMLSPRKCERPLSRPYHQLGDLRNSKPFDPESHNSHNWYQIAASYIPKQDNEYPEAWSPRLTMGRWQNCQIKTFGEKTFTFSKTRENPLTSDD